MAVSGKKLADPVFSKHLTPCPNTSSVSVFKELPSHISPQAGHVSPQAGHVSPKGRKEIERIFWMKKMRPSSGTLRLILFSLQFSTALHAFLSNKL